MRPLYLKSVATQLASLRRDVEALKRRTPAATAAAGVPWFVAEGDLPTDGTAASYFDFEIDPNNTGMAALNGTSSRVLITQTGLYLVLMSASYSDSVTATTVRLVLDGSFTTGGTKTYLQITSSNDSVAVGLNSGGSNNVWNVNQWFLVSVTAVTSGLVCVPSLIATSATPNPADSYVFGLRIGDAFTSGL